MSRCRYDTRTIDKVYPLRQGDVLPNFGFTGYRGNLAHFAAFQGVDDAALSNVRVSNETNRDLLLIGVKLGELAEQLDERAFAERVVRRCVEGKSWVSRSKVLDVSCL